MNALSCGLARVIAALALFVGLLVGGAPAATAAPGPNNINIFAIHTDGTVIPNLYIEMCSTTTPTRTCFFAGGFGDGNYVVQDYVPDTYTFRYIDSTDEFLDGYLTWAFTEDDAEVFDYTAGGEIGQAIQPLRPSSISGTLTDPNGAPIEGVKVRATSGSQSQQRGTAVSAVDGTYEIGGLQRGDYTISFDVEGVQGRPDFYPEYHDDAATLPDSTSFPLFNEQDAVVDAELARKPTIAGTVTDENGAGLGGVTVRACDVPAGSCVIETTEADGSYLLFVTAGSKNIRFEKNGYIGDYDRMTSVADGGAVTGFDTVLDQERSITGRVTSGDGTPIEGVQVQTSSGTKFTGADGVYVLDRLEPGEYTVRFYHPDYLLEWWDDALDPDDLTLVDLRTDVAATGVDAVLQVAGQISGTVTNAAGTPLELVLVRGCVAGGGCVSAQTDTDGTYTLGALDADDYVVSFERAGYVREYYDDGHFFLSNATSVSVELDDVVTGIDAVLTGPGTLAGTVTAAGAELSGAAVTVCTATQSCDFTSTASDGTWELAGLPASELTVSVDPPVSRPDLAVSLPMSVAAVADSTVSGVDVDLAVGGSIRGTVTEAGGRGLFSSEVIIEACSASLGVCESATPLSDPLGTYTIGNLPAADDYIVEFEPIYEPTPRAPQWWCGTENEAEARPVPVGAGDDVADIDAILRDIGAAIPPLPEACAAPADVFTLVTPQRFADSRDEPTFDGRFRDTGQRQSGTTWEIDIAGRGGVPADAQAAIVNVTIVNGIGKGFATVHPCGDLPVASSVNYGVGQIEPNEVIAKLSPRGTVCVYTLTTADVIVDVVGVVPADAAYVALEPARFADSRNEPTFDGDFRDTGRRPSRSTWEIDVAGRGNVPASAGAVVVNLTVTGSTGNGFATVYPCTTLPIASSLNYGSGITRPNELIAKLSDDGTLCVYTKTAVDVIVDVVGYIDIDADGYTALVPQRFADSRDEPTFDGRFRDTGRRTAGTPWEIDVAGRGSVPESATAVVVNVTATNSSRRGFITVFDCETPPTTSSLNIAEGVTRPNELIVDLSATGTICVQSSTDVDIVVDVVGFLSTG